MVFRINFLLYIGSCIDSSIPVVDIVITVKTNLKFLSPCVQSLLRHAPDDNVIHQRIVFVDDGSSATTLKYEKELCNSNPLMFICLETNATSRGYTRAIVKGINFGADAYITSSVLVLLNSDTIVTSQWLQSLYNGLMLNSNPKVMIVGPLSNAASYQSVPSQIERSGGWSTNPLAPGMNIDLLARRIVNSDNAPDEVPQMILNGFCFMFKRELITAIGNFDEEHYPKGYGEEVDFSIRAARAGFESRVIPRSYVYHSKTASFQPEERKSLSLSSRKTLIATYGETIFKDFYKKTSNQVALRALRKDVANYYESQRAQYPVLHTPVSICFYLIAVGMFGGVISVVTEAYQMLLYGVDVTLAIPSFSVYGNTTENVRLIVPDITDQDLRRLVVVYDSTSHFLKLAAAYDMIVATHFTTMPTCEGVVKQYPTKVLGYYAQDYEPWFIVPMKDPRDVDMGSLARTSKPYYEKAISSYTGNKKRLVIIAKTNWTAGMIERNHGVKVSRVIASMDHDIYYPSEMLLTSKLNKKFRGGSKINIVAMIRELSPRRNPLMTLEVLLRLAYSFPDKVRITIYGSDYNYVSGHVLRELRQLFTGPNATSPMYRTKRTLKMKSIEFRSVVKKRDAMADIFRAADIFLDLSLWQAFGRSGVEAMACGCIAIMPAIGASEEICQDGKYCLSHDGNDSVGYFQKVVSIMQNDTARYELIRNGIERAWSFTIEGAGASIANSLKFGYKYFHP